MRGTSTSFGGPSSVVPARVLEGHAPSWPCTQCQPTRPERVCRLYAFGSSRPLPPIWLRPHVRLRFAVAARVLASVGCGAGRGVEVATGVGAKQPAILCCPVTMSRCRQVSQSAEPVGKRLAGLRRARGRCHGRQVRAEVQRQFCPGQRSGGLRESNGFLGLRPNIRNIIGRWADPKIREIWTVTLRRGRIWVLPIGRIWRATLCRGRLWVLPIGRIWRATLCRGRIWAM